jgi:hypothetical protein
MLEPYECGTGALALILVTLHGKEPGGETGANTLSWIISISSTKTSVGCQIFSDSTTGFRTSPNDTVGGSLSITDSSGLIFGANVTFNDLTDVASNVPDNSSTLGLLAVSVLGLFGVARLWFARCA